MKFLFGLLLTFLTIAASPQDYAVTYLWDEKIPLNVDPSEVTKLDARKAENVDSLLSMLPQFTNVTWLNLWGLGIEELPDDIFENLTKLTWLDLGKNQLQTLPASFDSLTSLSYLGLYTNLLRDLPEVIYSLDLLELRASGNLLTDTFFISPKWDKMTYLSLSGNDVTALEGVRNLRKIERLSLSGCEIKELPDEFRKCKRLKYIHLNGNPLESLPKSLLQRWRVWYILIEDTNIPSETIRNYRVKYPKKVFDTCQTC